MIHSELTLPGSHCPLMLVEVPTNVVWLLQSFQAIAAALDEAATEIQKEVKKKNKSKAVS